ncbi:MAG: ABC transporter ATP-binding protein [Roseobacter sp.]
MSVSHRYRNFGGATASKNKSSDSSEEVAEEQKLQAFEAGYQAGWDDSTKAQSDEKDRVSAELSQNLLDMSFTYHEALSKLTGSLEPIMQQILDKLLPETVRAALSAHIMEQINELMKQQNQRPIEIVVHHDNVETVRAITEGQLKEPFVVVGEVSLGAGQAFVRVGEVERQVDLDAVIANVSKAMTAFFYEAGQEKQDG